MKKLKSKILHLLLVSALSIAAVGGGVMGVSAKAEDEGNITYAAPSSIFIATQSASVGADEDDKTKTAFLLPDGGKISFRRDMALKWHNGTAADFFKTTFSFKNLDFDTVTFKFEVAAAQASGETKATNLIVFTNNAGSVTVSVNDGTAHTVNTAADVTLTLKDNQPEEGTFDVLMNGGVIGQFNNIGSNFADYSASSLTPLTITAEVPEVAQGETEKKACIIMKSLNGQDFTLVEETGAIADDTAAPVLIVNQDLRLFNLGEKFSLNYQVVDVLSSGANAKSTLEYYMYNPTDTAAEYQTLTTSVAFTDTGFTCDAWGNTSVYEQEDMEFVSIKVKTSDAKYKDETAAVYDLADYAKQTVSPVNTVGNVVVDGTPVDNSAVAGLKYIAVTMDKTAPTFASGFVASDYQDQIDAKLTASVLRAGNDEYFYLPSLANMFEDANTDYKNLSFTIYYRCSAGKNTSTTCAYNKLQIPVKDAGDYEFKVVAQDKAGNKLSIAGEEVTADNVWELSQIPMFKFTVKEAELSVKDDKISARMATGLIESMYTLTEFTVEGPSTYSKSYSLFFFDTDAFDAKYPELHLDETQLYSIMYKNMVAQLDPAQVDDYAVEMAKLYAKNLALALGITEENAINAFVEALMEEDENGKIILRQIGEYDANFSEEAHPDNEYFWKSSSRTFVPTHAGVYVAFGVYSNPEEEPGKYVGAYKIIVVESREDIIAGETEWLQNNIVSIVLFSIAGVMLVIIVILLLIKPSDETLEDLDKKVSKKAKKKK